MATLSNSQLLRRKIGFVLDELVLASQSLTTHPRIVDLYPEYLFTVHSMIRASVPLMQTALTSAKALDASDPVAEGLIAYLTQHIKEEMHHDEWLLDDLEVIGVPRKSVLARMPSPAAAALVGSQYYWALHYHPVAILGYIAVMEGYPPTREFVDDLKLRTGYPDDAFRTIAKHGYLDPYHRDDLDRAVDELPLETQHHVLIGTSAMQSVHLSAQAFNEVVERAAKASRNAPTPAKNI